MTTKANSAINNLGWPLDRRTSAIDQILATMGKRPTDPARAELAAKSDVYLDARLEAAQAHERGKGIADGKAFNKAYRSIRDENEGRSKRIEDDARKAQTDGIDDAAGLAAYIAGTTRRGYQHFDQSALLGSRSDEAAEEDAWSKSVADLNGWRGRQDGASSHAPETHGSPLPTVGRNDEDDEEGAWNRANQNLNAWREG